MEAGQVGSAAIWISLAREAQALLRTASCMCSRWHFLCFEGPSHTPSVLLAKAGGVCKGSFSGMTLCTLEIGLSPWSSLWIRAAFWSNDVEITDSTAGSQSLEPSGSLSAFYFSQLLQMQRPCSGVMAFWIKSTANLDYAIMKQKSLPGKGVWWHLWSRWFRAFRGNSRWIGK